MKVLKDKNPVKEKVLKRHRDLFNSVSKLAKKMEKSLEEVSECIAREGREGYGSNPYFNEMRKKLLSGIIKKEIDALSYVIKASCEFDNCNLSLAYEIEEKLKRLAYFEKNARLNSKTYGILSNIYFREVS